MQVTLTNETILVRNGERVRFPGPERAAQHIRKVFPSQDWDTEWKGDGHLLLWGPGGRTDGLRVFSANPDLINELKHELRESVIPENDVKAHEEVSYRAAVRQWYEDSILFRPGYSLNRDRQQFLAVAIWTMMDEARCGTHSTTMENNRKVHSNTTITRSLYGAAQCLRKIEKFGPLGLSNLEWIAIFTDVATFQLVSAELRKNPSKIPQVMVSFCKDTKGEIHLKTSLAERCPDVQPN